MRFSTINVCGVSRLPCACPLSVLMLEAPYQDPGHIPVTLTFIFNLFMFCNFCTLICLLPSKSFIPKASVLMIYLLFLITSTVKATTLSTYFSVILLPLPPARGRIMSPSLVVSNV